MGLFGSAFQPFNPIMMNPLAQQGTPGQQPPSMSSKIGLIAAGLQDALTAFNNGANTSAKTGQPGTAVNDWRAQVEAQAAQARALEAQKALESPDAGSMSLGKLISLFGVDNGLALHKAMTPQQTHDEAGIWQTSPDGTIKLVQPAYKPVTAQADATTRFFNPLTGQAPAGGSAASGGGGDIVSAILGQESGGGKNIGPSVTGARGAFQIQPATFTQYAKPGERIDNPADNAAVGQRIIADLSQKYGGDPARIAVGYFSGPGNVAPPGSPTPWVRDVADPTGKTVSSYVADIQNRIAPSSQGGFAPIAGPPKPKFVPVTPEQAKADPSILGYRPDGTPVPRPPGTYSLLSPEAIKQGAAAWQITGKPPGSMRNRGDITAMQNYLATLKPPGMSDADWAWMVQNNKIALEAKSHAAGQASKAQVATAVNEGTVNNSIKILRGLLPDAASKGGFTDINTFNQWLARKTNDPKAANFKNAISSITNEYARIMTGSTTGAPTSDSARIEAANRIIDGYNANTIEAVLAQMQAEMRGRSDSYASVLKELTGGNYAGAAVPGSPPLPQNLPRKQPVSSGWTNFRAH